jgi:nitroimidazol reductase NimA-like FMN-containing flavoprotein (pyridoxamine 5'-phosphate oxidase superfamily)
MTFMNAPMRRKDRQLSESEAWEILERNEYGTLATICDDFSPYNTPLCYVILDKCVYFHCAKSGRKLDNIRREPRVCFSVVGKTQPVYHDGGYFSLYYESVVVFGTTSTVEDGSEKARMLEALCRKYLPANMEHFNEALINDLAATDVWKITVQEITGKAKKP